MKQSIRVLLALCLIFVLVSGSYAQTGKITGRVIDSATKQELVGANVQVVGTSMGAVSDMRGHFTISGVQSGDLKLKVSFVGYETAEKGVMVAAGKTVTANFSLTPTMIMTKGISIFADRAKERETPVAFTNIQKQEMAQRLGSRDIPMVLTTTPSVYATTSGGGAGDARINIRGFDQKNVAIMINGVPINDMENGWVYWSNWDGVSDATSSIQVQRGLSAVNLATPSIGGTMNIITDPSVQKAGITARQEYGTGNFLKSTLSVASGQINDKFSVNGTVVVKQGKGIVDKTYTDAWAYYFGAAYNINANNRLELYALGAPQRHGQNTNKQNIGVFNKEFALGLEGYDPAAAAKYVESSSGVLYNQNWNNVDPSYSGRQFYNGRTHERQTGNVLYERENYYHKPVVNLNWFSKLSDKAGLYSVAYYSGGRGGGSGTYGSVSSDKTRFPNPKDWNATIAKNRASTTGASGVLRNSTNNQDAFGLISKFNYEFSKNLKSAIGVDVRTAEVSHFREIRDMLGGEYYIDLKADKKSPRSDFWSAEQTKRRLGDKIDYDFTNTINWMGLYGQLEATMGKLSAYGTAGWSSVKYDHTNHFKKDAEGNELYLESDWIAGMQLKGGANFRMTDNLDLYANVGHIAKVPIFDNVILDGSSSLAKDPQTEKFLSIEGGINMNLLSNTLAAKLNVYRTAWTDRAVTLATIDAAGDEAIIFLSGLDQLHQGVELELAYQPFKLARLDATVGVGDWAHTSDVSGTYKDYSGDVEKEKSYNLYLDGLKVGDQPQTMLALSASVFPLSGLTMEFTARHYRDHYSYFNPLGRTSSADRAQSWKAPDYTLLDAHASYTLPVRAGEARFAIYAHLFNLLDEIYIQDAVDNSSYSAFGDKTHAADDAEVWMGYPRNFNIGIQVSY